MDSYDQSHVLSRIEVDFTSRQKCLAATSKHSTRTQYGYYGSYSSSSHFGRYLWSIYIYLAILIKLLVQYENNSAVMDNFLPFFSISFKFYMEIFLIYLNDIV